MRRVAPVARFLLCGTVASVCVIVASTALSSCASNSGNSLSPSGPTADNSSIQTAQEALLSRSVFGAYDYTDDYPYPDGAVGTVNPEWSFYYRECTDFVAWRMNRDAGTTSAPYFFTNNMGGGRWSNAENWASNAVKLGYVVNSSPAVGSIAHWESSELPSASFPGHVAYVEAVNEDGTVDVSEYNYGAAHTFGFHSHIVAPRYIHVLSKPSTSCVPSEFFVSAFGGELPFSSVFYVSEPNSAGDRAVVGAPRSLASLFLGIGQTPSRPARTPFCSPIELAPGLFVEAYTITGANLAGDFREFSGVLLDPFVGGRIDPARFSKIFAWPIRRVSARR